MILLWIIGWIVLAAAIGCLWGLIPRYYGRSRGQPNRGKWGQIFCTVSGPFLWSFLVMIGFVIAIHFCTWDAKPPRGQSTQPPPAPPAPRPSEPLPQSGLVLTCLSGPMKGRVYNVGREGLMFGRDSDCAVRFSPDTRGISRHHCAIRWQQGIPVLVDLNSAYGTFLGDGRKLPPSYPTAVAAGSRFYLAAPSNLFQITIQ